VLKTLLESARNIIAELGDGATQRAVHALHAIPPDERSVLASALERAAETWRQNEAFAPLNHVHLRANRHAQLFVRVFDPVAEPPRDEFDLLPEALRMMRRMTVLMRPELRAIWEPAVGGALEILTPAERAATVRFLERALTLVSGTPARDEEPPTECEPARKSATDSTKG
jgi:hypothetical protein